jgi:hypothetical protein
MGIKGGQFLSSMTIPAVKRKEKCISCQKKGIEHIIERQTKQVK